MVLASMFLLSDTDNKFQGIYQILLKTYLQFHASPQAIAALPSSRVCILMRRTVIVPFTQQIAHFQAILLLYLAKFKG